MSDDKLHHELLHNRLCKHLLGVHSKASNFAVRGELRCYPINICLYTRLLKFFFHLIEISQGNPLIENSLKECNILLEDRKTSWLSTISHLLQLIDLNLNQFFQCCHLDSKQIIHKVENKLKSLYEERFWSEISKSSRLGYLYRLLKKEYKLEQYVEDLFYHKYRSSVARLRVSAHFFPIETGRMMNKPREQRMCPFCLNKQIGDEHHYIFKCNSS